MRKFQAYIPEGLPPMPVIDPNLPLDIEIGCGVGLHPIQYCLAHPQRQLLAIEHTREKFDKFLRRSKQHKLENLYPIHANGISFLAAQDLQAKVETIFLLYPNPNPKPGHINRRWYAMPFMQYLGRLLKPGGRLVLASNELWYMEEARHYFKTVWGFPIQEFRSFSRESHPEVKGRTHFEEKYLARGMTCYQLVVKISDENPVC